MTRKGKIARLPLELRNEINRRLENGEPGKSILKWLNFMPQVQAILADQFGGRPITKQNLSEWKQNGFHDWQIHQAARECALAFDLKELAAQEAEIGPLSYKLTHWLALRYAAAAHDLDLRQARPIDQWRRLRRVSADILALRRSDLVAERLELEHQRLLLKLSTTKADGTPSAGASATTPNGTATNEALLR